MAGTQGFHTHNQNIQTIIDTINAEGLASQLVRSSKTPFYFFLKKERKRKRGGWGWGWGEGGTPSRGFIEIVQK